MQHEGEHGRIPNRGHVEEAEHGNGRFIAQLDDEQCEQHAAESHGALVAQIGGQYPVQQVGAHDVEAGGEGDDAHEHVVQQCERAHVGFVVGGQEVPRDHVEQDVEEAAMHDGGEPDTPQLQPLHHEERLLARLPQQTPVGAQ